MIIMLMRGNRVMIPTSQRADRPGETIPGDDQMPTKSKTVRMMAGNLKAIDNELWHIKAWGTRYVCIAEVNGNS